MPGPLLFLVFLQQALKLPALVFVEQLLDARLAITQYGAVILPKIVQNGLNLLGLRRRQVQFLAQAIEVEDLAGRGIERRLMEPAVNAEIHGQRARGRAAQEKQSQRHRTGKLGVPGSPGGHPLEETNTHKLSA